MLAIAATVSLCVGCGMGEPPREWALPERPADAITGQALAEEVRDLDLEEREERIFAEISKGNVPDWSRQLRKVEMSGEVGGQTRTVEFWSAPDYLAVGPDTAFFVFPLSPQTGQRVADLLSASLPTAPMVDAIWASARRRLTPIRIQPDDRMTTVEWFEWHERLVGGQRMLQNVPAGSLVAGHKKDVVLSAALEDNPGKVAIYGWHLPDGQPIQRLSTVLNDTWVDYSHGVRLVDRRVRVDGQDRDLNDVLVDPALAALLSTDGPIAQARYLDREVADTTSSRPGSSANSDVP